jgi:hypothetical protein
MQTVVKHPPMVNCNMTGFALFDPIIQANVLRGYIPPSDCTIAENAPGAGSYRSNSHLR